MSAILDAPPTPPVIGGPLGHPSSVGPIGHIGSGRAESFGAQTAGARCPEGAAPRYRPTPLRSPAAAGDHASPTGPATPDAPCLEAQPAFADVLDWHQAEIYRYALRLTGNRADADDLFQDTMLRAFRAFDRLRPDSNHRAWLYRVASNAFLSTRRKLDRQDSLDLLHDQTPFEPAADEPDHAAALDARALLAEVATFVDGLPPKQRLALTLRNHHGLAYDEIAGALGGTPGAARTNVHQALRKLRAAFGDRL